MCLLRSGSRRKLRAAHVAQRYCCFSEMRRSTKRIRSQTWRRLSRSLSASDGKSLGSVTCQTRLRLEELACRSKARILLPMRILPRISRKIGREEEEVIQHSFCLEARFARLPVLRQWVRVELCASTSCGLHSGLHELVIRYPRHSKIGCDTIPRQVTRWAHAWVCS